MVLVLLGIYTAFFLLMSSNVCMVYGWAENGDGFKRICYKYMNSVKL